MAYTERPLSFIKPCEQRSHDWIERVQCACAPSRLVFVAAPERERGALRDFRTKEKVTGTKAWCGSVGMIHHLESTVLETIGSLDASPMVGTTEEAALPRVALPVGKRRGAAAGQPGFELALVGATLQEPLRDGPSSAAETFGMKMEPNSGVRTDALDGVVVDALVEPRAFENGPDAIARLGTHASGDFSNMLKCLPLMRQ